MSDSTGTPTPGKKNLPGFRTAPTKAPAPRQPAVVLQPQAYRNLKSGTDLIANAVRPTLGPLPRLAVMERQNRGETPELLDDGATIARRIIEIAPRGHDVGAMLLRHAMWQMHAQVGDGSVTMAVMYQAIVAEGIRYIVQSGCNPMLLRAGLEKGLAAVREELRRGAEPLTGRGHITDMARGMVQGNDELASLLGEMFDMVGPDSLIVVERGNRAGLEREYIEGTYWHLSGWFSRLFVTNPAEGRTAFEDAALLISDLNITGPEMLVPVLERCAQAGVSKLVIIAKDISEAALGLLVRNNQAQTVTSVAVRTPRIAEADRVASMEDIAVMTGGRVFYSAAHTGFADFKVADLGHARRAWATESLFGIFGGKGDPRQIRRHILNVRGMLKLAQNDHEREMLQQRLGRLGGGTAVLRVSGATDTETDALKETALRAVTGVRRAIVGGVVPGGGTALLNAQAALAALTAANADEAIAYRVLSRALEEPMRAIAQNAGYQPDYIIEKVKAAPPGHGFEARSGQIRNMGQAGVVDAVLVLVKALEIAVSGAAQALTMDVIVHHRKPQECLEP